MGYRFLDPAFDKYLPDIKSYWPEEDSTDLIGPNDLTDVGTVTYSTGKNNNAAYLDTGDYQRITDGAQVGLEPAGSFSLSIWVYIVSFGADAFHSLITKANFVASQASYQLLIVKSSGAINFGISDDGSTVTALVTSGTIATGSWHHVFARFTASTEIAVFINGSKETNVTSIPAAAFGGTAEFQIGKRDDSNNPYRMNGRIDEPMFIDAAVDDAGVAALYAGGPGLFPNKPLSKSISVFDVRAKIESLSLSRFDSSRIQSVAAAPGRFDVRAKNTSKSLSRFGVSSKQVSMSLSRFDVRAKQESKTLSRFNIRLSQNSKSLSSSFSLIADGWNLVARNVGTGVFTVLGFIPAGSTTLNGIALANGTYDIEARPWGNFWRDCQSALVLRVEIAAGEIVAAIPPAVRSLRANTLTGRGRDILWTYFSDFGTVTPVDFGLWFGPTTPVDTSGAPDATLTARAAGATHLYRRAQVAAEYVAVAARDAVPVKGPVSELLLTFPAGAITSPSPQWAVRGS